MFYMKYINNTIPIVYRCVLESLVKYASNLLYWSLLNSFSDSFPACLCMTQGISFFRLLFQESYC